MARPRRSSASACLPPWACRAGTMSCRCRAATAACPFVGAGAAVHGIDRHAQGRHALRLLMADVAGLAAALEMRPYALDLRLQRGVGRAIEHAGHLPGAQPMLALQRGAARVRDAILRSGHVFGIAFLWRQRVQIIRHAEQARHEIGELQWAAEIDDLFYVLVVRKDEVEGARGGRGMSQMPTRVTMPKLTARTARPAPAPMRTARRAS